MSLLYKRPEDISTEVEFKQLENGKITLVFSADCGKFGAEELLDMYKLTPERLLQILQERVDITDEEIEF
jgi:hypothetical protein